MNKNIKLLAISGVAGAVGYFGANWIMSQPAISSKIPMPAKEAVKFGMVYGITSVVNRML